MRMHDSLRHRWGYSNMKYVMFEDETGHKLPVIFPEVMTHSVVAESVIHMMLMEEGKDVKVVSAGSIAMKACCSGKSETLGIASHEDDSMYVTFNDSIGGIEIADLPPMVLGTLLEGLK